MFENDHIQVMEQAIAPTVQVNPALPGPSLIVTLSPATLKVNDAAPIQLGRLAVHWVEDGIEHLQSAGDTDARLLLAHIKPRVSPPAPMLPDDGAITQPHAYKLVFENDRARVIVVVGGKGSRTDMHSHPGRAFRYFVTDIHSRRMAADGSCHEATQRAGDVAWSENPSSHSNQSLAGYETEVVLIEVR